MSVLPWWSALPARAARHPAGWRTAGPAGTQRHRSASQQFRISVPQQFGKLSCLQCAAGSWSLYSQRRWLQPNLPSQSGFIWQSQDSGLICSLVPRKLSPTMRKSFVAQSTRILCDWLDNNKCFCFRCAPCLSAGCQWTPSLGSCTSSSELMR